MRALASTWVSTLTISAALGGSLIAGGMILSAPSTLPTETESVSPIVTSRAVDVAGAAAAAGAAPGDAGVQATSAVAASDAAPLGSATTDAANGGAVAGAREVVEAEVREVGDDSEDDESDGVSDSDDRSDGDSDSDDEEDD